MKILIIEDEESAARQLVSLLNECVDQPEYLGIIDTVEESIHRLQQQPAADLLFIDIYLSDGAAFDIFKVIRLDTPVIFTTAYDQYAIQAFDVNSIDYLLKPIRKEKLQNALEKYRRLQKPIRPVHYKQHFLVPYKEKLIPITANDFAFFEIQHGVVRGITFDKKHWLLDETLDQLAEVLHPEQFYRANRQFLINRKAIREVEFYFNGRFCIHLSPQPREPVLVSKAKAGQFKDWMIK